MPPDRQAETARPDLGGHGLLRSFYLSAQRLEALSLHRGKPGEKAVANRGQWFRIHRVELLLAAACAMQHATLAQHHGDDVRSPVETTT
jgi:hypothetical protein